MLLGARDALFTCRPLHRPSRTFLPALRSCGLLASSSQACFLETGSISAPCAAPMFQRMSFQGVLLSLSKSLYSSSQGGLCPWSFSEETELGGESVGAGDGKMPRQQSRRGDADGQPATCCSPASAHQSCHVCLCFHRLT